MSDVVARHVDALTASVTLLQAQLAALRHAVSTPPEPSPRASRPDLPESCRAHARCGRRDEDARLSRATFGSPSAWVCAGCDETFTIQTTTKET